MGGSGGSSGSGDDFCLNPINSSMIIRICLSILSIGLFSIYRGILYDHIYLILPLLLTALDFSDNLFKLDRDYSHCTRIFDYQIKDKILDVLSYLFSYFLLGLDRGILYLTLWRAIGVGLFYWTRMSKWLVVFFDFVSRIKTCEGQYLLPLQMRPNLFSSRF